MTGPLPENDDDDGGDDDDEEEEEGNDDGGNDKDELLSQPFLDLVVVLALLFRTVLKPLRRHFPFGDVVDTVGILFPPSHFTSKCASAV